MKLYEEPCSIWLPEELLPWDAEETLFFDIETTGFSAQSAFLYLIGCVYKKNGHYYIRQWFLDNIATEKELLQSFLEFAGSFKGMLHFNGSTFDIPFLEKRGARHKITVDFSRFQSLDLYKEIKPYKKLLKLNNLKQKTLEEYIGLFREDPFTGGQLIELYYEYMDTKKDQLLKCLLLHNTEDLKGMLSLIGLRAVPALFEGNFSIESVSLRDYQKNDHSAGQELIFRLILSYKLPKPLSFLQKGYYLSAESESVGIRVPVSCGEFKHYYPNYQDYCYLPQEDRAIHKSVAAYVDRHFREKAKASNCYTKKTGLFLPQKKELFQPSFKESINSSIYFELTEHFLSDTDSQKKYLMHILADLLKEKPRPIEIREPES